MHGRLLKNAASKAAGNENNETHSLCTLRRARDRERFRHLSCRLARRAVANFRARQRCSGCGRKAGGNQRIRQSFLTRASHWRHLRLRCLRQPMRRPRVKPATDRMPSRRSDRCRNRSSSPARLRSLTRRAQDARRKSRQRRCQPGRSRPPSRPLLPRRLQCRVSSGEPAAVFVEVI